MSPDTRRGETITQLVARADAAIDNLRKLRADIPHLWRIGQHEATDAYPSSVRPADGPRAADDTSPTERAALDAVDALHQAVADNIGIHIAAIFDDLATIDTIAHRNEGRRQVIHKAAAKYLDGLNSRDECIVTRPRDGNERNHNVPLDRRHYVTGVGEDRLKSNYCQSCYRAWLRAKEADPLLSPTQFEVRRLREILEADRGRKAS
jgi:hypothetical protein